MWKYGFSRDLFELQPANCLLSDEGHVKISDLGLACDISASKPSERVYVQCVDVHIHVCKAVLVSQFISSVQKLVQSWWLRGLVAVAL